MITQPTERRRHVDRALKATAVFMQIVSKRGRISTFSLGFISLSLSCTNNRSQKETPALPKKHGRCSYLHGHSTSRSRFYFLPITEERNRSHIVRYIDLYLQVQSSHRRIPSAELDRRKYAED